MNLSEIALALGAELPPGTDPGMDISGANSLEDARPGEVAFFEHPKYLRALRATRAAVVLVPPAFAEALPPVLLRVAKPSAAFSIILDRLAPPAPPLLSGSHSTAVIDPAALVDPTACVHPGAVIEAGVTIGPRTQIGAHAFIGRGSRLGEDCVIHPHVTLYAGCRLGARVIIHSGSVIGADGFGFHLGDGRHQKVIHRGCVQLDDDVEVGACTTIDRARFGRTWIGTGTKIDNLVQIAHNVVVGPHCLIVSQAGISGSTRLGRYVILAGQVGVVGHVEIGDQAVVAAKSGVSKDVPAGQQVFGFAAVPVKEARELLAHYHRLPKTAAKLKALEQEVAALKDLVRELGEKGAMPQQ